MGAKPRLFGGWQAPGRSVHWEPSRRQTGCTTGQNLGTRHRRRQPFPHLAGCGSRTSRGHFGGPFAMGVGYGGRPAHKRLACRACQHACADLGQNRPVVSILARSRHVCRTPPRPSTSTASSSGEGRKTQDVFNPANQQVIGTLPHASRADLDLGPRSPPEGLRDLDARARPRPLRPSRARWLHSRCERAEDHRAQHHPRPGPAPGRSPRRGAAAPNTPSGTPRKPAASMAA